MLRKCVCFVLLAVLLCGCAVTEKPGEPAASIPTQPTQPAEPTGPSYPLLFLDTADGDPRAFVLCAYQDGALRKTDSYHYSGKPLEDYLDMDGETVVSSDILDMSLPLTFRDSQGNGFETYADQLTCTPRIMDGAVQVRARLQQLPLEKTYYLGTYGDRDIFPKDVILGDRVISADLNSDGKRDVISWTFTPAESDMYAEHFDFTISIEIGAKTYYIGSEDLLPCKEADLILFPADLDLDGNYELVLCTQGLSRFRSVVIYRLLADRAEEWLFCDVDIEP